ncbi:MAG: ABC transporter permease [Bacteroidota bacterium]|nr:ABC transporter permease [Bacteroidota bacterium]MDP4212555.1 ABC transporter permease [Bacteroidota bacterium]MDP4249862.1 ABC transporter permease [Bacteroidota bacterium]
MKSADSPQPSTWRRLKKNPGAVFGMVLISIALILAVFAYMLAPDHSPDANRMTLEIGGRKPGFRQTFLLLRKQRSIAAKSRIAESFTGEDDRYDYLPITNYAQRGDSLVVFKYIDEGISERQALLHLPSDPNLQIQKKTFWLGTDRYGRDILSRLIIGVRVSLAVGLITAILSLSIGILLGAIAGYFGGRSDQIIMWFLNVIWSVPTLLLVFALTLLLGKGFWQVFIAIGLTMWVNVARMVRGQVLAIKQLEYVEAARALGYSDVRIIGKHILPNILGSVLVIAASNFASAIVIEAGLSFLGIGVQPPQPSWGLMIKENYNFIITHNPMLALVPGIAIMLLVLSFNLLGNGLRDALNVKE